MKIEVKEVKFAYGDRPVLAIDQGSFEAGKIYGIVGKNGAGKTTFFKALTNILTNYRGLISYDGVTVKQNPEVLTKVGITLDDMELYKSYSGRFNIRYFGGLRGGFDEEKANAMAESLGIKEVLDQKVSQYSLGMSKKLILLISLMNDAEILIFDEPFRGIDAASVNFLRQYLLNLKAQGKLILISSHVQEDIESLCDEVRVLSEGNFAASYDLKDNSQTLLYTIAVSDVPAMVKILTARNISAMTKENLLRFDSTAAHFQEIFKEAVAMDIVFNEIKKESKFAGFVN
jgi:ABC-2 type transport system ATP-binding protein